MLVTKDVVSGLVADFCCSHQKAHAVHCDNTQGLKQNGGASGPSLEILSTEQILTLCMDNMHGLPSECKKPNQVISYI